MNRTMRGRIFYSIWSMALAVLFITFGISLYSMYQQLTQEQFTQLRNETELATQGVMMQGRDYLANLETKDFRVTWITEDGKVLFDSAADQTGMENHLEREEIKKALKNGYGESVRYSSTLADKQLYTAERLKDGTVLRLSITYSSQWTLVAGAALPVAIVAAVTLILSRLIASRLARNIVSPISKLDLNDPMSSMGSDAYEELQPMLNRLEEQRMQIIQDQEELEKTSRIRQDFTANASHELKTPLHVISGYAELLESGMVRDDDIKGFAAKIGKESQRMSMLVEDIIALSSLDSGAMDKKREPVDLYRVAGNAVDSLEQTAEDAGILLSLRGEPAMVNGIADVLYSMIYNLCLNGIKYTERGGKVWVEVRHRSEDGAAVLTVRDNGIGISRKDIGRIFERFYRVDKSRSKEVGGTGLGLSIVKHGAMIHGAQIDVESELGKGTQFTVVFP